MLRPGNEGSDSESSEESACPMRGAERGGRDGDNNDDDGFYSVEREEAARVLSMLEDGVFDALSRSCT